jgi:hypothetical protein
MENFNLKSALKTALMFAIAGNIVGFVWGFISFDNPNNGLSNTTWIVMTITAIILMFYFGSQHFSDPNNSPSALNGLLLGVTIVIFSALIDFLFLKVSGRTVDNYYDNKFFWIMIVLTITISTILGVAYSKDTNRS